MGKSLELSAYETIKLAEIVPIAEGKPDVTRISEIGLLGLTREFRMQKISFETARNIYDQMQPSWKGNKEFLLARLIALTERFIASDRVKITPSLFKHDSLRRRLMLTLNMTRLVQHVWEAIRFENATALVPVFDMECPIRSTGDMRAWFTSKPCHHAQKSHINQCVFDSSWEASEAFELDRSQHVEAWAKNDHLGFEILYVLRGAIKKHRPDFLIRLKGGGSEPSTPTVASATGPGTSPSTPPTSPTSCTSTRSGRRKVLRLARATLRLPGSRRRASRERPPDRPWLFCRRGRAGR